jgi:hypothetical protein
MNNAHDRILCGTATLITYFVLASAVTKYVAFPLRAGVLHPWWRNGRAHELVQRRLWTAPNLSIDLMIVTTHSDNVLCTTSGEWRIWSLSDGYIDMPADLLRDPQNRPASQAAQAGGLRLSVNCFALAGPGAEGVLIDSGGGGWASTVGRLEQLQSRSWHSPTRIRITCTDF